LTASDQRIAVVGAGISGLTAAWLLSRQHRVTLFEAADRLGGHTNTVDVTLGDISHPVDTGFLVFNDWTYPNFIALLKVLGVTDAASDMSFSVSLGGGAFEWAGSSDLGTVFAQPANVFKPAFWSMLYDLLRFNRATSALIPETLTGTLGEYLDQHGYGAPFRERYLIPMASCIWSTPSQRIAAFPLATFIAFCRNHGLLSVNRRPQWRTIQNGAREYVRRMAAGITEIRLKSPVRAVTRTAENITLRLDHAEERFDQVVLACHTDQSLRLLGDAVPEEHQMLSGIPYQANEAVLHTDASFLPRRRRAWAAWNFHAAAAKASDAPVSLTYWLNRLQPLPFEQPVLVTLNPVRRPAAGSEIARFDYQHPVYGPSAPAAQAQLAALQGQRRTWFAGAWTRYGFHEDGVRSGLAVAAGLGVVAPW
jgi:predicted NAD/FAD-binding protein